MRPRPCFMARPQTPARPDQFHDPSVYLGHWAEGVEHEGDSRFWSPYRNDLASKRAGAGTGDGIRWSGGTSRHTAHEYLLATTSAWTDQPYFERLRAVYAGFVQ
jgi:hypothetical protein